MKDFGTVRLNKSQILEKLLSHISNKHFSGMTFGACILAASGTFQSQTEGSSRDGVCNLCKESVWRAPSTRQLLKENPDMSIFMLCIDCLFKESISMGIFNIRDVVLGSISAKDEIRLAQMLR